MVDARQGIAYAADIDDEKSRPAAARKLLEFAR